LDRTGGIICFVSNGAWLDGNTTSGFRICLEKEFSNIYVLNLRGNQRTSGELSRKEGGKIFGSGSRTPIAITLLVNNPKAKNEIATIHYYDIGDYLKREEKLKIVKDFNSISNIDWKILSPNEQGDWINQRNESFKEFIPIADKSGNEPSFFNLNSNGVVTNRDAWVYNSCKAKLSEKMKGMISFYNEQVKMFRELQKNDKKLQAKNIVSTDAKRIKWVQNLYRDAQNGLELSFQKDEIVISIYRPFFKQYLYKHRNFVWSPYLQPKFFPKKNLNNLVICTTGIGASKNFTVLISNIIPNLDSLEKLQSFPLYYYEVINKHSDLFDKSETGDYIRRDGISDYILKLAEEKYCNKICKEDIFYYVYGFLHSPDYRKAFSNDLKKMLPRIPLVDKPKDFWGFSKAGRKLADLHVNYEKVSPYEDVVVTGAESGVFRVEKMRFPHKGVKDTILYNSHITIENIPEKAYEYVVNGKSAIEWIMDRYKVTTHKASGIKNDPNDWAEEVGNPRYALDLLLSIINVSVKTVEIVEGLPKVKFE